MVTLAAGASGCSTEIALEKKITAVMLGWCPAPDVRHGVNPPDTDLRIDRDNSQIIDSNVESSSEVRYGG
jgi:hypothetical protein